MGTTTTKQPGTVEKLLQGFRLTKEGRQAIAAAESADSLLEERKAARAQLDGAEKDVVALPPLAKKMHEAEARLIAETERLTQELHQARAAYEVVANSTWRRRTKAEALLRHTADPLVAENGPVVSALVSAIGRVRPYLSGADEARRLLATTKTIPVKSTENELFDQLRLRVRGADRAEEILPALQDSLEQVRALQLEVEVSPATVRGILLETCPDVGPGGEPLNIMRAMDGVPAPVVH